MKKGTQYKNGQSRFILYFNINFTFYFHFGSHKYCKILKQEKILIIILLLSSLNLQITPLVSFPPSVTLFLSSFLVISIHSQGSLQPLALRFLYLTSLLQLLTSIGTGLFFTSNTVTSHLSLRHLLSINSISHFMPFGIWSPSIL